MSLNPNVEVGAEGKVESRNNTMTSFSQIDDSEIPDPGKKAKSGEVGEKKTEPKRREKEEASAKADEDDAEGRDTGPKGEKKAPDKKANAEAKPEEAKPTPKPKSHKYRSGEETKEIASDSLFTVTVDGKKEDVPFQELVNNYSGKVAYGKKFEDLTKREKEHTQSVQTLTSHVQKLYENAQKDPESAFDWLADLTKQDPVELKANMMKQQVEQVVGLLRQIGVDLPEGVDQHLERYLHQQRLTWRERKLDRVEKTQVEDTKAQETAAKTRELRERYGIDEDSFTKTTEHLAKFFESNGRKEAPTTEEVIQAERTLLVMDVIQAEVPHLASHEKFGTIVSDVVEDLLKHPQMSREKLGTLLRETFGEEAQRRERLSRKVQERTNGSVTPAKAKDDRPVLSFNQLD